jgi:hypothetical protein
MPEIHSSPVHTLTNNILHAFENPHEGFVNRLKMTVEKGHVLPEIALLDDLVSPVGPKAVGAPAEIHLHITHLEVLWCFIYGWMVRYEEGFQKRALALEKGLAYSPAERLLSRANSLLEWSQSVADEYTCWPAELPSPVSWESSAEKCYTEKANLVFQEAAAFLLIHEWVHGTRNHIVNWHQLSRHEKLELEKEADNGAYDALVGDRTDNEKLHLAWAILSAVLSSFYLLPTKTPVNQSNHPELHHRVQHMLFGFNFIEEQLLAYFHGLCVEVLRDVFKNMQWSDPDDGYETAEACLQATLNQLDNMLVESATMSVCRSPIFQPGSFAR